MSFLQAFLGGAGKDRSKSALASSSRSHRTTLDHVGFCAPGRIPHYDRYGTCFNREELLRLIDLFNQYTSSAKTDRIVLSGQEDVRQLSRMLDAKLRHANAQCSQDATPDLCLLEQPFVKEQASNLYHTIKKAAFRPPKPLSWYKNKYTWLNTFNIEDVLKQYEQYDPTFKMLGVVPMDWANALGPSGKPQGYCIEPRVCNVRLSELRAAGKTDFGIVFNLDPHTKSGSHWVSAYCHFEPNDPKFGICYFDSYAKKPEEPVLEFMGSIKKQIQEMMPPEQAKEFKTLYNKDRKQYNGSECGMFCILFIMLCNEHPGLSYQDVCDLIHRDSQASALRDRLFSPARVRDPKP